MSDWADALAHDLVLPDVGRELRERGYLESSVARIASELRQAYLRGQRERESLSSQVAALRKRCGLQRRELKRLNRKIASFASYLQGRLLPHDGHGAIVWAERHHRNNELRRKLQIAEDTIAELRTRVSQVAP